MRQSTLSTRRLIRDVASRLPVAPGTNEFYVPKIGGVQGQMGFLVDETLCIGCKACEVACKAWNQLPADGLDFTGHSYDNTSTLSADTWRHVAFVEQIEGGVGRWLMMSDVCKHCVNAPCLEACPTGALVYNEFGDVYVQQDICNGCGYCIIACPYGVLTDSKEDGHVHKCTLCYDRQKSGMEPACAKTCPTESIQFGPIDELRIKAYHRLNELRGKGDKEVYIYGDKPTNEYSRLHSIFLLRDHPNTYNLPEAPCRPVNKMGTRYAYGFGAAALLTVFAAAIIARGR